MELNGMKMGKWVLKTEQNPSSLRTLQVYQAICSSSTKSELLVGNLLLLPILLAELLWKIDSFALYSIDVPPLLKSCSPQPPPS